MENIAVIPHWWIYCVPFRGWGSEDPQGRREPFQQKGDGGVLWDRAGGCGESVALVSKTFPRGYIGFDFRSWLVSQQDTKI